MAAQNWDWIFHTLGWSLAGIGLLLALWALFWDRSRGRKRCPKCWYSMEGAVEGKDGSLTCPECGKEISNPRRLHKTRRRWRWLALPMLFIPLGTAGIVGPTLQRDGWDALPSWMLIEALAWRADPSLLDTLDKRLDNPRRREWMFSSIRNWDFDEEIPSGWDESKLSDWEWNRLTSRLSMMLGSEDRFAPLWAIDAIAQKLPNPYPALPELKWKLRAGTIRERHHAASTVVMWARDNKHANTREDMRRLQSEFEPYIPDLIKLLEHRKKNEVRSEYPLNPLLERIRWLGYPKGLSGPVTDEGIVRANAADAIGFLRIEDADAIAALERAAEDSDELVALVAESALYYLKNGDYLRN